MASRSVVVFDSGVVGAGAIIVAQDARLGGPLDLTPYDTIEVIADNVAGAANRLLTLDQYLDDGATNIDAALPLRNLQPGKRVRGLLSPNPPGGTSGVRTLYDVTSAANTALDTGALDLEDFDAVEITVHGSAVMAGAPAITLFAQQESDGLFQSLAFAPIPVAAVDASLPWGPGSSAGFNTNASSGIGSGSPLPRSGKVTLGAGGAAVTCRMVITGRGRIPGTFSVPMVIPTRAKFTLAAGGAANGRLTVIGRYRS